jgi:hypothetical protein
MLSTISKFVQKKLIKPAEFYFFIFFLFFFFFFFFMNPQVSWLGSVVRFMLRKQKKRKKEKKRKEKKRKEKKRKEKERKEKKKKEKENGSGSCDYRVEPARGRPGRRDRSHRAYAMHPRPRVHSPRDAGRADRRGDGGVRAAHPAHDPWDLPDDDPARREESEAGVADVLVDHGG